MRTTRMLGMALILASLACLQAPDKAPPPGGDDSPVSDSGKPDSGGGTATCSQVFACSVSCGKDGPVGAIQCINQCAETGTPEARDLASELSTCLGKACPVSVTSESFFHYMDCAYDACGEEFEDCMGFGKESCGDILACVQLCPPSTQADCLFSCFRGGSLDANQRLVDLLICLDERCHGMSVDICAQTTCIGEASNCMLGAPK